MSYASDSDERDFEVEKILEKRIEKDGSVSYKLKWLGFDE